MTSIPVHARRDDRLHDVEPRRRLPPGRLDGVHLRLHGDEPRLRRRKFAPLVVTIDRSSEVDSAEEQPRDRSRDAPPNWSVRRAGESPPTEANGGSADARIGGRRLTARISSPPRARSRRPARPGRRGRRDAVGRSRPPTSGSARRTRARISRSSSSTSPGSGVVPPVTRISRIGERPGLALVVLRARRRARGRGLTARA